MSVTRNNAVFERRSYRSSAPLITIDADRVRLPNGQEFSEFRQLILEDFGVVVRKVADGCHLVLRQLKQDQASEDANLPKFFPDVPAKNFAEEEISLACIEGTGSAVNSLYTLSLNHASAIAFSHMMEAAAA